MHYYKRNIGDYAKKAGRLTMLQHGAYTLLLDACYDREKFPTLEQAIEWTWAQTQEEIDAVKFVLTRFFKLTSNDEYVQDRILEELLTYHKNADTNKRIAVEREAKRREKSTNRAQSVDEAPPNHKPITINQEPNKKATVVAAPEGVSQEVWDSFVKQRKAARAVITPVVIKTIAAEAEKAGWTLENALSECAARGWRGFKAEWVADKGHNKSFAQQAADVARMTVPAENKGPDPALLKIESDRQKAAPMPAHIRDRINSVLRKV